MFACFERCINKVIKENLELYGICNTVNYALVKILERFKKCHENIFKLYHTKTVITSCKYAKILQMTGVLVWPK